MLSLRRYGMKTKVGLNEGSKIKKWDKVNKLKTCLLAITSSALFSTFSLFSLPAPPSSAFHLFAFVFVFVFVFVFWFASSALAA